MMAIGVLSLFRLVFLWITKEVSWPQFLSCCRKKVRPWLTNLNFETIMLRFILESTVDSLLWSLIVCSYMTSNKTFGAKAQDVFSNFVGVAMMFVVFGALFYVIYAAT
jgi:hypothetical protein